MTLDWLPWDEKRMARVRFTELAIHRLNDVSDAIFFGPLGY
jgi:hypothetical protein